MIDINWANYQGAIWRSHSQSWHAVTEIYASLLDDLINVDSQKSTLLENTERFVSKSEGHHALLWGARGTGKSSLIKAVVKRYVGKNLRIVQLDKKDLIILPDLIDDLRVMPFKFIIFLDDLSFSEVNDEYQSLKTCIEGNIEEPAANVLFYVTSNKKHMISQSLKQNFLAEVIDETIRPSDIIEDKLALADRFGLTIGFYSISQDEYLKIINLKLDIDIESNLELRRSAIQFATQKGVRNARTAQQFCLNLSK